MADVENSYQPEEELTEGDEQIQELIENNDQQKGEELSETQKSFLLRWTRWIDKGLLGKLIDQPVDPLRRQFLRNALIGAGAVALAATVPEIARAASPKPPAPPIGPDLNPSQNETPPTAETIDSLEIEHSTTSNQLFLDFAPMTPEDYETAKNVPINSVSFLPIDTIVARMRTDWEQANPNSEPLPPEVDEYLTELFKQFSSHGYNMVDIANTINNNLHARKYENDHPVSYPDKVVIPPNPNQRQYNLVPLQPMLEIVGPYTPQLPTAENIKESGYYFRLPPEKIIDALKEQSEMIINLSFQVGTLGVVKRETTEVDTDTLLSFSSYRINRDGEQRFYILDNTKEQRLIGITQYVDDSRTPISEKTTRVIINGEEYYYVEDLNGHVSPIINQQTGEELTTYSQEEMEELLAEDRQKNIDLGHTNTTTTYEPLSAYIGEYTEQNLRDLCSIAQAYPDKLFFTALGNFGEDITEVRKKLESEGKWPSNLYIIGEAEKHVIRDQDHVVQAVTDRPKYGTAGADIFIKNIFGSGSSAATDHISSIANYLLLNTEDGLTPEESRELIIRRLHELGKTTVDMSTGKEFILFDTDTLLEDL